MLTPDLASGGGAELDQKLGRLLAVAARDLQALRSGFLGEDRERDAQRRLPQAVEGVDLGALGHQVLDHRIEPLVSGRVQCRPAELPDGIDVDAVLDEELRRVEGGRPLFERAGALHVGAGPDDRISAVVPPLVAIFGSAPAPTRALMASRC